ncbi:MAG TPA: hypothetical protein V6C91_06975 [Coleofasciculaceae cyanobacterium]
MSTEPVSNFCHRDLFSARRVNSSEAKLEQADTLHVSEPRLASYLRRVPSVAIYTLATLAAQDFAHQALATPVVDLAQQPQLKESGDLVALDRTEEATAKPASLESASSAVASPESLNKPEFAPEALATSETPIAQLEQEAQPRMLPTLQQFSSEPTTTLTEDTQTLMGSEVETDGQTSQTPVKTAVESPVSQVRNSIAPPETEFALGQRSEWKTQAKSEIPPAATRLASAKELAASTSDRARDLQIAATSKQSTVLSNIEETRTSQAEVTPQQTATAVQTKAVVAQNTPTKTKPCLQALATRNNPKANELCSQVEDLQQQLRDVENIKVKDELQASPALSIVIPTGFGADNNTGFISATFQERTRFSNVSDGGLGIGIGLGDARKAVGVELSYTAASFGGSRDFGAGGFNVKVHRQLGNDWAVAAGWNGAINIGGPNDFEDSLYGTVTKVLKTREDINAPFSRVAVTAGVGTGQFQSASAIAEDKDGVNVFGNVALRVAKPVSVIAEWSGQDLGVGVSIAPFKNIPLVITPAVRDLVGAGDGPRFVLGTGFAFKF